MSGMPKLKAPRLDPALTPDAPSFSDACASQRAHKRVRSSQDDPEDIVVGKKHCAGIGAVFSVDLSVSFSALHMKLSLLSPRSLIQQLQTAEVNFMRLVSSSKFTDDATNLCKIIDVLDTLVQHVNKDQDILVDINKAVFNPIMEEHTAFIPMSYLLQKIPTDAKKRQVFRTRVSKMCLVFQYLLKQFPTQAIVILPIDVLNGTVHQLALQDKYYQGFMQTTKELLTQRNKISMEIFSKQNTKEDVEGSILPVPSELNCHKLPPLKKNRVKGPYQSTMEYLETHYELLREDLIHPLRKALYPNKEKRDREIKMYRDVNILCYEYMQRDGLVFVVSFDISGMGNHQWKGNKHLKCGNLLCLSSNNFRSFIFAKIVKRDPDNLSSGRCTIKFINEDGIQLLHQGRSHKMIESPSYYEAFFPVLRCLKARIADPGNVPLLQVLALCKTSKQNPLYMRLREANEVIFDFSHLCSLPTNQIAVQHEESWSDLDIECLNLSQKEALKEGLTSEIALIQGPPGTGKTYLGIKIVETLLQNRNIWNPEPSFHSPIVVLCYTNHALDQFLEGLLNLNTFKIKRIGGRSQNVSIRRKCILKMEEYTQQGIPGIRMQNFTVLLEEFLEKGINPQRNIMSYLQFFDQNTLAKLKEECNFQWMEKLGDQPTALVDWLNIHKTPSVKKEHCKSVDESEEMQQAYLFQNDELEPEVELAQVDSKRFSDFLRAFSPIKAAPKAQVQKHSVNPLGLCSRHKYETFKYCLEVLRKILVKQFYEKQELDEERAQEMRTKKAIEALQTADVIGLTTTGAAKYNHILSRLQSKVVVIEEAAEVLEAHVIAALTQTTEQLIMIGDQKQLRPRVNEYILARDYKLDISLFERLIDNGFPRVVLDTQHRMRPEISQFVSQHLYHEENLKDATSVNCYENVRGMMYNIYFIHHENPEDNGEGLRSPNNEFEAMFLARLCKHLLKQRQFSQNEITVLSPYRGQDVLLRKVFDEKRLDDVRITCIDNYQGEENKIILLSLVRSVRPGFVTEFNRICVALSRAQRGFYCIGNFRLFTQTSTVWHNIIEDAKKKGFYGTSLPLECAIHKKVTIISCPKDFFNYFKNGCTQKCEYMLECGHNCQGICHAYDAEHSDNNIIYCEESCNSQLKCGHLCAKKCHGVRIPHTTQCLKPCPKIICRDNHRCPKKCYENCQILCKREILREFPKCGHKRSYHCCIDFSEIKCPSVCERLLKCGHQCKNYCWEECTKICMEYVPKKCSLGHTILCPCSFDQSKTDEKCSEKVPKTLPKCGHTQEVCCYKDPSEIKCESKCELQLELCGHQCTELCGEKCTEYCTEEVDRKCPRGHELKVACHIKKPEEYSQFCTTLCNQELLCGDLCQALCGHCNQGRIHMPCKNNCKRPLFCGHECNKMCGQTCQCSDECSVKCPHFKCKHPCKEKCIPCNEPCKWKCKHFKCTKLCSETCDRPKCDKPCNTLLRCKHPCCGLCGELCPDVCRVCDPKMFKEIAVRFWGDSDETTRLIKLADCRHIFEVSGLDKFITTNPIEGDPEIGWKSCPDCRTAILTTLRYRDVTRQVLSDMNAVKDKITFKLNPQEIVMKKNELRKLKAKYQFPDYTVRDQRLESPLYDTTLHFNRTRKLQQPLSPQIDDSQLADEYNLLTAIESVTNAEENMKHMRILQDSPLLEYYVLQKKQLVQWVKIIYKMRAVTKQTEADLQSEKWRLLLLSQLYIIIGKFAGSQELEDKLTVSDFSELQLLLEKLDGLRASDSCSSTEMNGPTDPCSSSQLLQKMKTSEDEQRNLNRLHKIDSEEEYELLKSQMKDLCDRYPGLSALTVEEKQMIIKAIDAKAGSFYKCPDGHYYQIGQCGGAIQQSKCPECRATIGGTSHRLAHGNEHAPEFDGASASAWPIARPLR